LRIVGAKVAAEEKVRAPDEDERGEVFIRPNRSATTPKRSPMLTEAVAMSICKITPQGMPAGVIRSTSNTQLKKEVPPSCNGSTCIGNTRTKDKVIRREVLIAPGDVFNSVRVETTKKRLDNLGYFSKVETYPEDTGIGNRRDLVIQVEEKRTGSLNFGAGFSTIDNLVGFVEMSQGNFDLPIGLTSLVQDKNSAFVCNTAPAEKMLFFPSSNRISLIGRLSLGGQIFYNEADYYSDIYSQRHYGFSI
jgi:outer membrane protein insertion porin family